MKKMKKINGYLIVRFNDRERRAFPCLGSYGVIDAECYTGDLDVDRGSMEYDDADCIEAAVEQARGLENELDLGDEPATFAVIRESGADTVETAADPQTMLEGWEEELRAHIAGERHPEITPREGCHELHGYMEALADLGLIEKDEIEVPFDHFGPEENALPATSGELMAYVCDQVCRRVDNAPSQEEVDSVCGRCALSRLSQAAEQQRERLRDAAALDIGLLTSTLRDPWDEDPRAYERIEAQAYGYLLGALTAQTISPEEFQRQSQWLADRRRENALPPIDHERETFESLPPERQGGTVRAVYALGRELGVGCPQNDCRVYRNLFVICQELDEQVETLSGYPRKLIGLELQRQYLELERMYLFNHAVKEYRRGKREERAMAEAERINAGEEKGPSDQQTTPDEEELQPNLEPFPV